MPVDQDGGAKLGARLVEQGLQRHVVGPVHGFDPPPRLAEGELAAVDFLPLRHHPGNGAKPRRHPRRTRRCERRKRVFEHPLI